MRARMQTHADARTRTLAHAPTLRTSPLHSEQGGAGQILRPAGHAWAGRVARAGGDLLVRDRPRMGAHGLHGRTRTLPACPSAYIRLGAGRRGCFPLHSPHVPSRALHTSSKHAHARAHTHTRPPVHHQAAVEPAGEPPGHGEAHAPGGAHQGLPAGQEGECAHSPRRQRQRNSG